MTSKSLKWPWQTFFKADPEDLEEVPEGLETSLPKVFSCLGLIGLTVLLGIKHRAGLKTLKPQPG